MKTFDPTRIMTLGGLGSLGAAMPFSHSLSPFVGLGDITVNENLGSQLTEDGGYYVSPAAVQANMAYGLALTVVGGGLSLVHGWQRTGHAGWTLGWAVLGLLFPTPTVFYALGQGFGKRKRG